MIEADTKQSFKITAKGTKYSKTIQHKPASETSKSGETGKYAFSKRSFAGLVKQIANQITR